MPKQYLTAANLVTVFRLFLFGVFVWLLLGSWVTPALIFLAAAWALDALDGWLARRFKQTSSFGSKLDKGVDRLILILGIALLIKYRYLPPPAIFLLVKDIALLPALTIHWARREAVAGLGWSGKIMTVLQGASVVWLLAGWPAATLVVAIVAAAGATASFQQLRRIAY